MAPWESGLPAAVTMPSTVLGSSWAAWVGVRSAVTRMPASVWVGAGGVAEEVGEDLFADGANVVGPGLEVRVGELGRSGRRARRRRPARRARP